MSLVKVKDYEHLRKDLSNGGVVNVDEEAYRKYKATKQKAFEQAKRLEQQERRINNIEKDVKEIKDLLFKIASKLNGN